MHRPPSPRPGEAAAEVAPRAAHEARPRQAAPDQLSFHDKGEDGAKEGMKRKTAISTSGSSLSWSKESTPGAPGSASLQAVQRQSSTCSSNFSSMTRTWRAEAEGADRGLTKIAPTEEPAGAEFGDAMLSFGIASTEDFGAGRRLTLDCAGSQQKAPARSPTKPGQQRVSIGMLRSYPCGGSLSCPLRSISTLC